MAENDIQTLTRFNLAGAEDGYLLEIGGSDGGLLRVAASPEQIEAILEAHHALLSDEDDAVGDTGGSRPSGKPWPTGRAVSICAFPDAPASKSAQPTETPCPA